MKIQTLVGIILSLSVAASAEAEVFVDRLYLMGEDPDENAVVGETIDMKSPTGGLAQNATADSARVPGGTQTTVDLAPAFAGGWTPKYVEVTDRPDFAEGETGIAIEFTASEFDHILGQRLGTPATSISSTFAGGSINYTSILDRGLQFWTKPLAVPATESGSPDEDVHIVMDTNNHGALINTFGQYTMRYNGEDFPGTGEAAAAAVDDWAHIMVVRPDGATSGSRMYVNGIAVATAPGDYLRDVPPGGGQDDVPDTAPLVVGGGTQPDSGFEQGFINNYDGVVDELELFVTGINSSGDLGIFDLGTDNHYVAAFGPSNPLDLAGDDDAVTLADAQAFADNWLYEKTVNGIRVGDLETVTKGDFNYDGVVDLLDWEKLNAADPLVAAAAMTRIQAVPEPSAAALMLSTMFFFSWLLRRDAK